MPTKGLKTYKQDKWKHYWEFDGKRYEIQGIRNTQAGADKLAAGFRKRGYLARVLQFMPNFPKYGVYVRSTK
jgi:hypothetical protein